MGVRPAAFALIGALMAVPALHAQQPWTPPAFVSGVLPDTPVQAIGGGQVLLDAEIAADGRVRDITILRATPAFTDPAVAAVRGWRFVAAGAAHVLVAYVARPPTLTAGPTLGAPPADVAPASEGVAFPTVIVEPDYPANTSGRAEALLEIAVDETGRITDVKVDQSAGGFDSTAIAAARQWAFRPARVDDAFVATTVYAIFAWRPPVVSPRSPR